jgi:hypothetical protein
MNGEGRRVDEDRGCRRVEYLLETGIKEFIPTGPLDLIFFDCEFDIRPMEMARFRRFASQRCVWALHDSRHDGLQAALEDLRKSHVVMEVLQPPTPRGLALGRYIDPGRE